MDKKLSTTLGSQIAVYFAGRESKRKTPLQKRGNKADERKSPDKVQPAQTDEKKAVGKTRPGKTVLQKTPKRETPNTKKRTMSR